MQHVVTNRCPAARQVAATIDRPGVIADGCYVADFVELEEVIVPAEEDGHVVAAVEQVLADDLQNSSFNLMHNNMQFRFKSGTLGNRVRSDHSTF